LPVFTAVSNVCAQTQTPTEETAEETDGKKAINLRHEVAVYVAGGMSELNYSLDAKGSKTGGNSIISSLFGLGYTWNITECLGIVTGLEISNYSAKTAYDAVTDERIYGSGIDRLKFGYSMNNYIEEQDVLLLSIPAMAQYSTPLSNTIKYYLAGGLKIGLPVKSEATVFPGTVRTWGEFISYDSERQTYFDDLPQHGFMYGQPPSFETDIDTHISLIASIESGAQFALYSKILLYTGIYLDCGLNSIRSAKDRQLINYQEFNPSALKYASVLNTAHVNKVRIFGAGLKVKISFGW
jgi:hypothetical protein